MNTWTRGSLAAHAVSTSGPLGPYTRVGEAIGTETLNVLYAYSAVDKMHLIYSIFGGVSPASCNPPFIGCTNGTTPNTTGGVRPRQWEPQNTCPSTPPDGKNSAHIHYSKSLDGPWKSTGRLIPSAAGCHGCGISNPAPFIFPNGTVLMIGRGKDSVRTPGMPVVTGHNLWLYRASSWNSTYVWVPGKGVNGSLDVGNYTRQDPTEDPVLYRGRRGFHMLLHSAAGLTHGYSEDGLTWHSNNVIMGPLQAGGGPNERPRVILDPKTGDLAAIVVGQLIKQGSDASRTAAFKVKQKVHTTGDRG